MKKIIGIIAIGMLLIFSFSLANGSTSNMGSSKNIIQNNIVKIEYQDNTDLYYSGGKDLNGNEYIKYIKQDFKVTNGKKVQYLVPSFSTSNKKVAKLAGNSDLLDGYSMRLSMGSFGEFINISPKGKYTTYRIGIYESYGYEAFNMMDITNGKDDIISWGVNSCNREIGDQNGGIRTKDGSRYVYPESSGDNTNLYYTLKGQFPKKSVLAKNITGIKKITTDKNYIYVDFWKKCTNQGQSGYFSKKYTIKNLK